MLVSNRNKIWNEATSNTYHFLVPITSSQRNSAWKTQWCTVSTWSVWNQASVTAGKSVSWYNPSKSNLALSIKSLTIYPAEIEQVLKHVCSARSTEAMWIIAKKKKSTYYSTQVLVNKWWYIIQCDYCPVKNYDLDVYSYKNVDTIYWKYMYKTEPKIHHLYIYILLKAQIDINLNTKMYPCIFFHYFFIFLH